MTKANSVVLASGNAGKLREFADLLRPLDLDVRPQSEWNVPSVPEDGTTFIENALIKARHAARHTGLAAIADDSGLVVPSLGGAPGVYSARYAGVHGDAAANNRKLLEAMAELRGNARAAYFYCAIAWLESESDPVPVVACGRWDGAVAAAPRGDRGFGYDPLFEVPGRDMTAAELDPEEKARLSHRGQATRGLIGLLRARHAG